MPIFSPSEDEESQEEEAHGRGDHRGYGLGRVAAEPRGEVGVGPEPVRRQPQQRAAHRDVEQTLRGEQAHLFAVVTGLLPEGPHRIPQVAVGVGEDQRRHVVEDEQLGAARGGEEQEEVERADVHEHVGDADSRELGVLHPVLFLGPAHSQTVPQAPAYAGVSAHLRADVPLPSAELPGPFPEPICLRAWQSCTRTFAGGTLGNPYAASRTNPTKMGLSPMSLRKSRRRPISCGRVVVIGLCRR